MSRVAKSPIELPSGVAVTVQDDLVKVKGPKGELTHKLHQFVRLKQEGNTLHVVANENVPPQSGSKNMIVCSKDAIAGTTRAIIKNHVVGVSNGFEKKLQMVGVGYRAQMQGNKLNVTAGFSHPVLFDVPKGIVIETPTQTEILIKGSDRQVVGQVAADIRSIRPPEPYKGKGIRYSDETIVIKETKKK